MRASASGRGQFDVTLMAVEDTDLDKLESFNS
jgi:hypothetical protein